MNKNLLKLKGFTVLEIASVLAVVGLLAAFLVPMISGVGMETDAKQVTASINTMEAAVNQYFAENQAYPDTLTDAKFDKYLPKNAKVTALKSRVKYAKNADNTFCLSCEVSGKTIVSPSSNCDGEALPPVVFDPFAPPAEGATLGEWETFMTRNVFTENSSSFGQRDISKDGKVYRPMSVDNPACRVEVIDVVKGSVSCITAPERINNSSRSVAIGDDIWFFDADMTGKKKTYVFHPSTETWEEKGVLPVQTYSSGYIVSGTDVYFIGGGSGSGIDQRLQGKSIAKYDTLTNTYSIVSSALPTSPSYIEVRTKPNCAVIGDKIYVIGGEGTQKIGYNTFEFNYTNVDIFDLSTQTWSKGTNIPDTKGQGSVTVAGEKIYMAGGFGTATNPTVMRGYDTVANTWTTGSNMGTTDAASINYYNGALYAFSSYQNYTGTVPSGINTFQMKKVAFQ